MRCAISWDLLSRDRITQYADDTTVLVRNLDSVPQLLKLLNNFKNISGLEINKHKTEAIRLGSWRNCNEKLFGFKWPLNSVYALGVHFSYDPVPVHSRTNSAQLEKKKPHSHWQDKHRQNTRSSQTCIPHLAFDNLETAY